MTLRAKKTILGDSTNTYNNFNTANAYEIPRLTKSTSVQINAKGPFCIVDTPSSSSATTHSFGLSIQTSYKPMMHYHHIANITTSGDSTNDDSLSISSNNTGPSPYDLAIDNSDCCSNYSFDNTPTTTNSGASTTTSTPALAEDGCTILNSALGQKKKAVPDDTKYKTELCKNWNETGKCNYGKKCKFAHGKHELNEKALLNKARYKSKKCNSFFSTCYCPYGVRCLFAHEQRSVEDMNSEFYYQKYLLYPQLRECPSTENKRSLPIFRSLHSSHHHHHSSASSSCASSNNNTTCGQSHHYQHQQQYDSISHTTAASSQGYIAEDESDYEQDRGLWEAFEIKEEHNNVKKLFNQLNYSVSF